MNRYLKLTIPLVLCGVSTFLLSAYPSDASYKEPTRQEYAYRSNLIAFEPTTPAVEQTKYVKGMSLSNSTPGGYIFQRDDLNWLAQYGGGQDVIPADKSSGSPPYLPQLGNIHYDLDFDKEVYRPSDGYDLQVSVSSDLYGVRIDPRLMLHTKVTAVKNINSENGLVTAYYPLSEDNNQFRLNLEIGNPKYVPWTGETKFYENGPNGPKYSTVYGPELELEWWGVYRESKKISTQVNQTMQIGETQQGRAFVDTRRPKLASPSPTYEYTGKPTEITGREETVWQVESGDSVTVTTEGLITTVKEGKNCYWFQWTF